MKAIDLRKDPPERGRWLLPVLIDSIIRTLEKKQQALLYLNRRGYAPLTPLPHLRPSHRLPACTAWLVGAPVFATGSIATTAGSRCRCPRSAPNAVSPMASWRAVPRRAHRGRGGRPLPRCEARPAVIGSDPFARRDARGQQTHRGREADIIIGTQMVAKGHHYPRSCDRRHRRWRSWTGPGGSTGSRAYVPAAASGDRACGPHAGARRGFVQTYMPEHPVMQAINLG